jgi:hypothetical protein
MVVLNIVRCEGDVALYAQICDGLVIGMCSQYPGAEPKLLPDAIGTPTRALVGEWELISPKYVPPLLRFSVALMHAWLRWNMCRVH